MVQEPEKIKIANRLREVRERCGYTQETFAAELEISYSGYKKIESGENGLSLDIILMLQKLGFPVDYIVFGNMEDVQAVWSQLERCSEADKLRIMLRLIHYFTNTKKRSFQVGDIEYEEFNYEIIKDMFSNEDTDD